MACEIDMAYDRIRELLPPDWIIIGMVQDSGGWRVSVGKRVYNIEQSWEPTIETRAGSLVKAMDRLIDRLEQM